MRAVENPFRHKGLACAALQDVPYPSVTSERPLDLLRSCPRAARTPLLTADGIAQRCGVGAVFLKDERGRMGLGSFKALGAAYVIARDAAEGRARGITYITASAGNHGLSVAAGAQAFGARAVVYISEQVPQSFARRLQAEGADVVRQGATYEDSMQAAADAAENTGAVLLSDSSWPGYTARPLTLMEGYLVVMEEVFARMDQAPTHIFLQAGVGGLAGAAAAIARAHWGDGPVIVVVEPEAAPALIASIEAAKPVVASGPVSVMGRLDCKEPSLIALKGLSRDADLFMTISEAEGLAGADLCAEHGLATTPSGAAGIAGLAAAADHAAASLDGASRVLAILSESAEP